MRLSVIRLRDPVPNRLAAAFRPGCIAKACSLLSSFVVVTISEEDHHIDAFIQMCQDYSGSMIPGD